MAKDLNQISQILRDYSDELQESITASAEEVANTGVAKLQATSPVRKTNGGKYARGWRQKTTKGARYVHSTISNKHYQLTHLLEYGHATRNGGRTREFKHIEPVEEYCIDEFTRKVEEAIKGGK